MYMEYGSSHGRRNNNWAPELADHPSREHPAACSIRSQGQKFPFTVYLERVFAFPFLEGSFQSPISPYKLTLKGPSGTLDLVSKRFRLRFTPNDNPTATSQITLNHLHPVLLTLRHLTRIHCDIVGEEDYFDRLFKDFLQSQIGYIQPLFLQLGSNNVSFNNELIARSVIAQGELYDLTFSLLENAALRGDIQLLPSVFERYAQQKLQGASDRFLTWHHRLLDKFCEELEAHRSCLEAEIQASEASRSRYVHHQRDPSAFQATKLMAFAFSMVCSVAGQDDNSQIKIKSEKVTEINQLNQAIQKESQSPEQLTALKQLVDITLPPATRALDRGATSRLSALCRQYCEMDEIIRSAYQDTINLLKNPPVDGTLRVTMMSILSRTAELPEWVKNSGARLRHR